MFNNRLAAFLLCLLLSSSLACAQVNLPLLGVGGKAVAGAYSGPGDVVSGAFAWWGLRAYSNALANSGVSTTPVIDVVGATSGSCTIFLKGDGTGAVDLTTAGAGGLGNQCASGATTFCTVTNASCTISKMYDQSGGLQCTGAPCPIVQGTVASQPGLTFNCQNGFPCVNGTSVAAQNLCTSATPTSLSQPITLTSVVKPTSLPSGGTVTIGSNTGTIQLSIVTGPLWRMFAGTVQTVATAFNAWYAIVGVFNGASSTFDINGSATTVNPGAGSFATLKLCMFGISNVANTELIGSGAEGGIWSGSFNSTQYGNMTSNIRTYWGF
jgi:hypothetical protein